MDAARSLQIRDISGLSRAAFARKYNIPVRTLEEWDSERRKAPEWVLDLLERVVQIDSKNSHETPTEQ